MVCGAVIVRGLGRCNAPLDEVFCNEGVMHRRRGIFSSTGRLVCSSRSGAGKQAACCQEERSQEDAEMGETEFHTLTLGRRGRLTLIEIKVVTVSKVACSRISSQSRDSLAIADAGEPQRHSWPAER